MTHDDLLLDAIRGANVEDAASPDEGRLGRLGRLDETSDDPAAARGRAARERLGARRGIDLDPDGR